MTRRTIADLSGFLLRHGVVIAPSGFGCLATATEQATLTTSSQPWTPTSPGNGAPGGPSAEEFS